MFEQVLLCFEKYIVKNLRNCLIEYILTSSFLFFFFFLSPCVSSQFAVGERLPEWIWAWFAQYFSRIIRKEALTCKLK